MAESRKVRGQKEHPEEMEENSKATGPRRLPVVNTAERSAEVSKERGAFPLRSATVAGALGESHCGGFHGGRDWAVMCGSGVGRGEEIPPPCVTS